MNTGTEKRKDPNKGFLAWVERVGNKIPHSFIRDCEIVCV